jgi:hypothetical protein
MEKYRIVDCATCKKPTSFKRPSVLYYGKALHVKHCRCNQIVTTIWYEVPGNVQATP